MQEKKTKQLNIRLTQDDQELIRLLQKEYGMSTEIAAIRLALRLAQHFPPLSWGPVVEKK